MHSQMVQLSNTVTASRLELVLLFRAGAAKKKSCKWYTSIFSSDHWCCWLEIWLWTLSLAEEREIFSSCHILLNNCLYFPMPACLFSLLPALHELLSNMWLTFKKCPVNTFSMTSARTAALWTFPYLFTFL